MTKGVSLVSCFLVTFIEGYCSQESVHLHRQQESVGWRIVSSLDFFGVSRKLQKN